MEIAVKKYKPITFNIHLLNKQVRRSLDLEKVEEAIRTGKIDVAKSKFPKSCLVRYYGKENITYYVIIYEDEDFIEAVTAWTKKGK